MVSHRIIEKRPPTEAALLIEFFTSRPRGAAGVQVVSSLVYPPSFGASWRVPRSSRSAVAHASGWSR